MRLHILLLPFAMAACGGRGSPDDADIHARMELGHGGNWDYRNIERGRAHDATAAEAQAGDIPQGTTVWPVHVSATRQVGGHAVDVRRDLLFYRAGEDRHWVGINAPLGNTDRYARLFRASRSRV